MRAMHTIMAAVLGAVFGVTLLYGLALCWAMAYWDFGDGWYAVTIGVVGVGAVGGGLARYAIGRPAWPNEPGA